MVDDLDFFPDLSVVEHLDLLARAHGLAEPDQLVDEVLEEVQLVPQSSQLPGTLSSGQRRRLALATALVQQKLLVMDEPEQRLDVEGVAWLGARLKHEMTKGLAIVMASHEPSLVDALDCPAWCGWGRRRKQASRRWRRSSNREPDQQTQASPVDPETGATPTTAGGRS